ASGDWQSFDSMEGYYYQSIGKRDWDGAVKECEEKGGTVADFLSANSCPTVSAYWLPIRGNGNYIWEATYRGTRIPVIAPRFGEEPPINECVAISCTDLKCV
ncbi:hypothetical protein PMAYCL1PPCAC_31678, partial [Pristionchus mayeri]